MPLWRPADPNGRRRGCTAAELPGEGESGDRSNRYREAATGRRSGGEPIDMTANFVIHVADSAVEHNEAAAEYAAAADDPVAFPSRDHAETLVRRLNREGTTPVRLQRVAPQDPRDVDAYLVAIPRGDPREPVDSGDGEWTFDVTANQYGALGEALVRTFVRDPPPLVPFVREDLDGFLRSAPDVEFDALDEFELRVTLDRDPSPVTVDEDGVRLQWRPDCVAEARAGTAGPVLRRYWCEIKSGDASFQRDQRRVMRSKAATDPVLAVRFDIDELPLRYTVRISEVEP